MQRIQLPVESEEITLADIVSNPIEYFIFFKNKNEIVGIVLYDTDEREFSTFNSSDRKSSTYYQTLMVAFTDFKELYDFPDLEIFAQKI